MRIKTKAEWVLLRNLICSLRYPRPEDSGEVTLARSPLCGLKALVCCCASSHLPRISARHRSKWDPTGTWGSRSLPARIQGSTGRWWRFRGWGQGATCSSTRWWSRAAQNRCRSSAPLLAVGSSRWCGGEERQGGKRKIKNYRYPCHSYQHNEERQWYRDAEIF